GRYSTSCTGAISVPQRRRSPATMCRAWAPLWPAFIEEVRMIDLLMGVDDTDVVGRKPGTGRLARELGARLEAQGHARLVGVVRQQLLVDPRIPYTSHNSPACLLLSVEGVANGSLRQLFA